MAHIAGGEASAPGPAAVPAPAAVDGDPVHPTDLVGPTSTRLGLGEDTAGGLQRICLEQLDQAIAGLTTDEDRDEGVHSARKAMKRIRAMIRFVRETVGYAVYRDENVVLRDTARRIAVVRDSAVLVETLDAVTESHRSRLAPAAFAGVRRQLWERHLRVTGEVLGDRQLIGEVVTNLRVSRARFASWPMDPSAATPMRHLVPDDFGSIAGGIHRVYRRGRMRMGRAGEERTTAAFHLWRKQVKYLRYQMEALESVWPEAIGGYARSLDALGEALGLEHDLAVLEETIGEEPTLCDDSEERRLLGALILHERAVLRHGARRAGLLVYAEDPDVFVARIGAYWEASRSA